jgi:hypothetical protein
MSQRPDSAVYQRADAVLRERHRGEWEEIRSELLKQEGIELHRADSEAIRARKRAKQERRHSERWCENPECGKSLQGMRVDARFCSSHCKEVVRRRGARHGG